MTVSVLSDRQGQYRVPQLPAGAYEISAKTTGLKSGAPARVSLSTDQSAPLDFTLAKTAVQWSDLSLYQGSVLLPDGRARRRSSPTASPATASRRGWRRTRRTTRRNGARSSTTWWARCISSSAASGISRRRTRARGRLSHPIVRAGFEAATADRAGEIPGGDASAAQRRGAEDRYVEYDMPGPSACRGAPCRTKRANVWIPYYGGAKRSRGSMPRPARSRRSRRRTRAPPPSTPPCRRPTGRCG